MSEKSHSVLACSTFDNEDATTEFSRCYRCRDRQIYVGMIEHAVAKRRDDEGQVHMLEERAHLV